MNPASTVPSLRPSPRLCPGEWKEGGRAQAQDKAFQLSLRCSVTTFISFLVFVVLTAGPSFGAGTKSPEEIWKELERLSQAEREKKLIEGAKNEGEMIWYTNSGPRERQPLYSGLQADLPLHQRAGLAIQDAPSDPEGHCRSQRRSPHRRRYQALDGSAPRVVRKESYRPLRDAHASHLPGSRQKHLFYEYELRFSCLRLQPSQGGPQRCAEDLG